MRHSDRWKRAILICVCGILSAAAGPPPERHVNDFCAVLTESRCHVGKHRCRLRYWPLPVFLGAKLFRSHGSDGCPGARCPPRPSSRRVLRLEYSMPSVFLVNSARTPGREHPVSHRGRGVGELHARSDPAPAGCHKERLLESLSELRRDHAATMSVLPPGAHVTRGAPFLFGQLRRPFKRCDACDARPDFNDGGAIQTSCWNGEQSISRSLTATKRSRALCCWNPFPPLHGKAESRLAAGLVWTACRDIVVTSRCRARIDSMAAFYALGRPLPRQGWQPPGARDNQVGKNGVQRASHRAKSSPVAAERGNARRPRSFPLTRFHSL